MKKLFTLALAATTLLSAAAADYSVYNNGALGGGINVYGWWAAGMDFAAANPAGGDTKVFSFKADNGGAAASMGLFNDGSTIKTGKLNSATLNYKWYATGTATCTVRLTADGGVEQNYTWDVAADNAGTWNETALPVATTYPEVSQQWKDYVGKGAGYVFSIILDNASSDFVIYFDNIVYTSLDEAWTAPETPEIIPPTTVPAVEQPQDKVLSIFSAYGNYPFNIGGWGQSTTSQDVTIDGKEAKKLTNFNYLGWELQPAVDVTDYQYVHVDFYPCEQTPFGFTIISPGNEKAWIAPEVKLNEWNSYDVPLTFWTNVQLNNVFQMKFDQGAKVECYLANVYFYKTEGGDTPGPGPDPGNGAVYSDEVEGSVEQNMGEPKTYPYVLKYSITYNEDKTLTISADFNWTEGEPVGLVTGSVYVNNEINDFTAIPRVVTTRTTYTSGDIIPVNFYLPMSLGVVQKEIMYTVGSSNPTGVKAEVVTDAAPVYYTIDGVRVASPGKGLYIRVLNGTATKVIL